MTLWLLILTKVSFLRHRSIHYSNCAFLDECKLWKPLNRKEKIARRSKRDKLGSSELCTDVWIRSREKLTKDWFLHDIKSVLFPSFLWFVLKITQDYTVFQNTRCSKTNIWTWVSTAVTWRHFLNGSVTQHPLVVFVRGGERNAVHRGFIREGSFCRIFFYIIIFSHCIFIFFKVIPQKTKKATEIFLKAFPKWPLPMSVSKKYNLKDRSPCLFKKYDEQNLPHSCLFWH